MKKEVLILVLILAFLFLFVLFLKNNSQNNKTGMPSVDNKNEFNETLNNSKNKESSEGSSRNNNSSPENENTENENIEEMPDISSYECGYYFEKYGICDGTCPEGKCVQEGRSCYCKK